MRKQNKNIKLTTVITTLFLLAFLLLLDHYRIHGYWYDTHDLLLKTDSGLGFDSHEFFIMLFTFLGASLAGYKIFTKIIKTRPSV
jgi:hypothetical protein